MEILRCLHFSDNNLQPSSSSPSYDRLYKIRSILDLVSTHFMEFVDFEPHLSVDEQMVPFKARIHIVIFFATQLFFEEVHITYDIWRE
jgi:hypothetical protein